MTKIFEKCSDLYNDAKFIIEKIDYLRNEKEICNQNVNKYESELKENPFTETPIELVNQEGKFDPSLCDRINNTQSLKSLNNDLGETLDNLLSCVESETKANYPAGEVVVEDHHIGG